MEVHLSQSYLALISYESFVLTNERPPLFRGVQTSVFRDTSNNNSLFCLFRETQTHSRKQQDEIQYFCGSNKDNTDQYFTDYYRTFTNRLQLYIYFLCDVWTVKRICVNNLNIPSTDVHIHTNTCVHVHTYTFVLFYVSQTV